VFYAVLDDGSYNVYVEAAADNPTTIAGRAWTDADASRGFEFSMKVSEDEPRLDEWFFVWGIMRAPLVDALKNAGVETLQSAPAVVRRSDNGETVPQYMAVAISGQVAMAAAVSGNLGIHGMNFDPSTVNGMKLFSLSGFLTICDEDVAAILRERGVEGITLKPLQPVD
jgi:hypothetical protein